MFVCWHLRYFNSIAIYEYFISQNSPWKEAFQTTLQRWTKNGAKYLPNSWIFQNQMVLIPKFKIK